MHWTEIVQLVTDILVVFLVSWKRTRSRKDDDV